MFRSDGEGFQCRPLFCSQLAVVRIKWYLLGEQLRIGHMLIGYARVSTNEQNLDLQTDALKAAGCERIFHDLGVSGAKADRPGLTEALEYVRPGDVLVVWRLDRLGRSLSHLIESVASLGDREVEFRSLTEVIDTSSAAGKLIFHMMGAMAEFERNLAKERTLAGLAAARARGRSGGRVKKLDAKQIDMARTVATKGESTVPEICEQFGISRKTYYRYVHPNRW
jgi:DNA invertase Pin-like site-specific DNA recombinase